MAYIICKSPPEIGTEKRREKERKKKEKEEVFVWKYVHE